MSRFKIVAFFAAAVLASRASLAAVSFTENFSTNPSNSWSIGIGDNTRTQITWNSSAPSAYAGDPVGELDVHLDSSVPTVRFQRPLGVTVTDADDFTLTARFSFEVVSAPDEQGMQIAFGLVNSSLTGGDRTGTFTNLSSDNTFHTVEFNYFPNVSQVFNAGPTLSPAVCGGQIATNEHAFANFASLFGSDSNLGDNTNGLTALPQNVTLQATLVYSSAARILTLTMSQVNLDGSLTPLDTEVPPMDLVAHGYSTNFPFKVDALAIMAYQDGFTSTNDPSLIADLQFQEIDFTTTAPRLPGYVSIEVLGTNVALAFPTISTFQYYVETTTNLVSGPWSAVATNLPGTGGVVTNVDVGGATVPQRFYRIGVVVP